MGACSGVTCSQNWGFHIFLCFGEGLLMNKHIFSCLPAKWGLCFSEWVLVPCQWYFCFFWEVTSWWKSERMSIPSIYCVYRISMQALKQLLILDVFLKWTGIFKCWHLHMAEFMEYVTLHSKQNIFNWIIHTLIKPLITTSCMTCKHRCMNLHNSSCNTENCYHL